MHYLLGPFFYNPLHSTEPSYLYGVVVLAGLYVEFPTGGKIFRLLQVALDPVVLKGLNSVVQLFLSVSLTSR